MFSEMMKRNEFRFPKTSTRYQTDEEYERHMEWVRSLPMPDLSIYTQEDLYRSFMLGARSRGEITDKITSAILSVMDLEKAITKAEKNRAEHYDIIARMKWFVENKEDTFNELPWERKLEMMKT
jgi:hypothetical protein